MNFGLYATYALIGMAGFLAGYIQVLHISKLTGKALKYIAVSVGLFLFILGFLYWLEVMPRRLAVLFSIGLYVLAAGFFGGSALKIWIIQRKNGPLQYINPSPLTSVFPKALSAAIIAFGFYRTNLLIDFPVTAISLSSGISLITFGCYGWSLQIVPELRKKGIILLDRKISWDQVLTFSWREENILCVEYYNKEGTLVEFLTTVPPADQKKVTKIIEEHLIERLTDED